MDGPLVTNHLRTKIKELLDFAAITLAGIQVELVKNDFEGLLKVKEHLRNIDTRNEELQTGFDVCAATIRFLRSYDIPWLEDVDLKLQKAGRLWRQARETADITAVRIQPLVKEASLQLKLELADYEETVTEYAESHRENLYWKYDTGHEDALERLDISKENHKKEWMPTFHQKLHVATVFDIPDLVENSRRI
jgi:hypothetical protein